MLAPWVFHGKLADPPGGFLSEIPQCDAVVDRGDRRKKIRRMRLAAVGLMALAFPLCIWDYRRDFALILPTLLGINCFVISLRLFHWAYMELESLREKERKAK